jgi:CubicO group peptidase (beta-lactamase class C family)
MVNPFKPVYNHELYSLSKSFTSIAIGFAVQEGLLTVEDYVVSYFKDKLPCQPCENMKKMKIKHLLNMCTGHSVEPDIMKDDQDWVYLFLTSYVDCEPGSIFVYNTPATYMLSAILQKITGITIYDYLQPRLFEPLGISDVWWELYPKGISTGGFGLNAKTEDVAKFGTFLLNNGVWEGKQLLNSEWINKASSKVIESLSNPDNAEQHPKDWIQGYGYQFWRCQPEGVYRADGAFGQFCIVMPDQDAILAMQSGEDDTQTILNCVWDILLPAMKDTVPEDKESQMALEDKLSGLIYKAPAGEATSPIADKVSRKEYEVSENPIKLTKIVFDFADTNKVTMTLGEESYTAEIGFQKWIDNQTGINKEDTKVFLKYNDISCAGAWIKEDTFKFEILYNRIPTKEIFEIKFHEKGISIYFESQHCFDAIKFNVMGW